MEQEICSVEAELLADTISRALGDEARIEIGLIRIFCARMLNNSIDRAIQVHGSLDLT